MTESLRRWLETVGTRGARVLVILLIAFTLVRILKALTTRLVQIAKGQTRAAVQREQQTRTMAGIVYSVGASLIVAIAVLTALPEFGFDVTPFEAAAAVGSAWALGFGAQNLVKDIINGFFIVIEDQFVVGDLIQLNGETGRVEYLTLRRTVVRNVSGAIVTIPNSLVGQVANLSRDWSQTFVDVTVPSDEMVGRALATLEKICGDFRNDANWSPVVVDGPRVLGVESLALDGTVLRLQVRTVLNRKDDVARELRRRMKIAFEESSDPAYPHAPTRGQGSRPEPRPGIVRERARTFHSSQCIRPYTRRKLNGKSNARPSRPAVEALRNSARAENARGPRLVLFEVSSCDARRYPEAGADGQPGKRLHAHGHQLLGHGRQHGEPRPHRRKRSSSRTTGEQWFVFERIKTVCASPCANAARIRACTATLKST